MPSASQTDIYVASTAGDEVPESITRAVIRLDRLRTNAARISQCADPASIIAVVKANAYGHGAARCSAALAQAGVNFFAVGSLAEAAQLRTSGISGRILILGSPLPEQLAWYKKLNVELAVATPEILQSVLERSIILEGVRIHLKVDTGMGRIGFSPEQFLEAVVRLQAADVPIKSIWTHYANADNPDDPLTANQRTRLLDLIHQAGLSGIDVHLMNTGSLIAGSGSGPTGNRVRVGISLYGATGFASTIRDELHPVMSFRSKIVQIKSVSAGTGISYGHRWKADSDTRIATVGAGYADGYPRSVSANGTVGINGVLFPVVGTVCMGMFMVNIGQNDSVFVGDDVILWGEGGPTVDDVARWAGTIPYELFCGVGVRVPRIYIDKD